MSKATDQRLAETAAALRAVYQRHPDGCCLAVVTGGSASNEAVLSALAQAMDRGHVACVEAVQYLNLMKRRKGRRQVMAEAMRAAAGE